MEVASAVGSVSLVSSAVEDSGTAEDVEDVIAEELSSVVEEMGVEMELVRLDDVTVVKAVLVGKVEKEDMAWVAVVEVSGIVARDGQHTGRVGHGGGRQAIASTTGWTRVGFDSCGVSRAARVGEVWKQMLAGWWNAMGAERYAGRASERAGDKERYGQEERGVSGGVVIPCQCRG